MSKKRKTLIIIVLLVVILDVFAVITFSNYIKFTHMKARPETIECEPIKILKDKFALLKTDSVALVIFDYDTHENYEGYFAAKYKVDPNYVDKLQEDLTTSFKGQSDYGRDSHYAASWWDLDENSILSYYSNTETMDKLFRLGTPTERTIHIQIYVTKNSDGNNYLYLSVT
jgi:hypothetical protein